MSSTLCLTIAANDYPIRYLDCLLSQRMYALRHGFRFVAANSFPWAITAEQASWLKVALMKSALERGHTLAFFDADCLLRTHAPSFTKTFEGSSMVMAPGKSGRPNAGVFFARPTEASIHNVNFLIDRSDEVLSVPDVGWENAHVIHYFSELQDLRLVEHVKWNNNSHYNRQSYVQHFASGEIRQWRERRPVPKLLAKLAAARSATGASINALGHLKLSEFLNDYAKSYADSLIA